MAGKKPESARQEAVRLISEMSDKQIMITFEAFNIQLEDETKTPVFGSGENIPFASGKASQM